MSHPFNKIRQSNVERARVKGLTSGYKAGGKVFKGHGTTGDIAGEMAKTRADRPHRATGGKVAKKGNVVVNVITGGQQPAPPPMMPPPEAMAPPPPPPPGPPPGAMGPPPGVGGPMGGPPPGMPMRARGGGVKSVGLDVGTKVTHKPGKNDLDDMNRKRVVTFASGGGVKSFVARARGGPISSPATGVAPATKLPGGAGGGKGRLAKRKMY